MQIRHRPLAGVVVAASGPWLMVGAAHAVILTGTGFEAPDYAPGTLAGQSGWIAQSSGVTSGDLGVVVNNAANAHAGSQYAMVNTAGWAGDFVGESVSYVDNSSGFLANVGSRPVVHAHLSIWMSTTTGNRTNYALMQPFSSNPFSRNLGAIGMYGGGAFGSYYLYLPNDPGHVVNFSNTFSLNQYRTFDMYLNYNTGLISYSLNGIPVDGQLDSTGRNRTFNTSLAFTGFGLDTRWVAGLTGSGGTEIRYDDYLVEMIPAPANLPFLVAAGLVASRRRRT